MRRRLIVDGVVLGLLALGGLSYALGPRLTEYRDKSRELQRLGSELPWLMENNKARAERTGLEQQQLLLAEAIAHASELAPQLGHGFYLQQLNEARNALADSCLKANAARRLNGNDPTQVALAARAYAEALDHFIAVVAGFWEQHHPHSDRAVP